MLKVRIEENVNVDALDERIINAFQQTIDLYNDADIMKLWEEVRGCKFHNHRIGRGGNHIWITRKADNERIAMIVN